MPLARRVFVLALVLLATVTLAPATPVAWGRDLRPAPIGSDPYFAGRPYTGDFPDPTIMRAGRRWYAFSTTIAGINLPELISSDLRTWVAHPPWRVGQPRNNDALPLPAAWAQSTYTARGRRFATTWAPSVAKFWRGHFVAAYAEPVRGATPSRFCIGIATATSPLGPFVDRTRAPVVCPSDQGAIDPQIFTNPWGVRWLLWKTEGTHSVTTTNPDGTTTTVPGQPAALWSQRLTGWGTALYPGSTPTQLLTVESPWEGHVVESPAMIYLNRRFYLFYSGNDWASSAYGIGYAVCPSMTAACTRPSENPLLASQGRLAGPGGAVPFRDLAGRLRMIYHAWTTGQVGYPATASCARTPAGCPQRRLHIATLALDPATGLLSVRATG